MAQELKEIEKYKEDFSKYYQVIRRFKGRKLKQQVKIYGSKFSHIWKRSSQHHINILTTAAFIKRDTDVNNTRENGCD